MQASCKEGEIWTHKSVKNDFKIEELLERSPPAPRQRIVERESLAQCLPAL